MCPLIKDIDFVHMFDAGQLFHKYEFNFLDSYRSNKA